MGFFDSFSKKKENVSLNLSDLPPPPIPQFKNKAEDRFPEKEIPAPPMPPPSIQNINQEKIIPVNQVRIQMPVVNINSAPNFEMKEKSASLIAESRPPELPKKLELRQETGLGAPKNLPLMPRSYAKLASQESYNLGVFADTYEEVPYFSENSQMIDLPLMEISDAEEKEPMFPIANTRSPLFIRTDNYSNVLSTIDTINDYIMISSDAIYSLENLKKNTEVEHKNYKSLMEDIQRKLIYIDKVLFEKGAV